MSVQNRATHDILKRKKHSISDEILYFSYFKRRLLETEAVREFFASTRTVMTQQEFGVFLESDKDCRLSKYAPYVITKQKNRKRSVESVKRRARELKAQCYQYYLSLLSPDSLIEVLPSKRYNNQLGLFVRQRAGTSRTTAVARGEYLFKDVLWGPLFEISAEDDAELEDKNHGSLSLIDGKRYVVAGALAFLNHRCDYPLGFCDELNEPRPVPPQPLRKRKWYAFGANVPLMHVRNNYNKLTFKPGDEITVDYEVTFIEHPTFGDDCLCETCKPPDDNNDEDDEEDKQRKRNKKK